MRLKLVPSETKFDFFSRWKLASARRSVRSPRRQRPRKGWASNPPALGGGVDVDVVEPDPRPADDDEVPASVENRLGDGGRRPNDESVGFRYRQP